MRLWESRAGEGGHLLHREVPPVLLACGLLHQPSGLAAWAPTPGTAGCGDSGTARAEGQGQAGCLAALSSWQTAARTGKEPFPLQTGLRTWGLAGHLPFVLLFMIVRTDQINLPEYLWAGACRRRFYFPPISPKHAVVFILFRSSVSECLFNLPHKSRCLDLLPRPSSSW